MEQIFKFLVSILIVAIICLIYYMVKVFMKHTKSDDGFLEITENVIPIGNRNWVNMVDVNSLISIIKKDDLKSIDDGELTYRVIELLRRYENLKNQK